MKKHSDGLFWDSIQLIWEAMTHRQNSGGEKKRKRGLSQFHAVRYLLKHGSRGSEWQEAGLLQAITEVMMDVPRGTTFTVPELQKLIDWAMHY